MPKPLSTLGTPPSLQMCKQHQVYTTMCKCVSIFTNIFPKGYVSILLDSNAYSQEKDLVVLDSRDHCDFPS